ncbi:RusA family crossover junction endodeoxyribonuclease [Lactobacillus murinus]|uniref:RusA family crossover junction endodeoxyribonuclease n=2 Tax=Ligilactobacillus murinus TaxID=1622 RepID=A0AAE6WL86_9LACO|nr:RusA family crossover junction endodeoxyribonuclease [Ligilactobacillus murinus]NEF85389.1 RusA family crossover junction endodeoxyribonuclease [Ligilactobacillus murinus]NEF87780.1 RusA family crossover junction endodeoxyribonuclease [Ligilactobacillus murinus]NEF90086.1 RusA family crossover junction endodeoxyribonuclease [Ligilactobacillus murinus]NEF92357.1 RusA family crossover junction endodeoxyribonuclease [Ligilactobacillus murinus]
MGKTGTKGKEIAMRFDIPLKPQNASRPNFNSQGQAPRAFMQRKYRDWRHEFDKWFNDWLEETNARIFKELMFLNGHIDDLDYLYRNSHGRLKPEFEGWSFNIVFVIERPKSVDRGFPVSGGDLDNYAKAVIDGIFENPIAKMNRLNDKFIQDLHVTKRYTWLDSDEKPHIEVEVNMIG